MFRDVADFGAFVDNLKSGGDCGLDGQSPELFPLKREVELSAKFADALNLTYFGTQEVPEAFKGLELTEEEIRKRVFAHELERVFSV